MLENAPERRVPSSRRIARRDHCYRVRSQGSGHWKDRRYPATREQRHAVNLDSGTTVKDQGVATRICRTELSFWTGNSPTACQRQPAGLPDLIVPDLADGISD